MADRPPTNTTYTPSPPPVIDPNSPLYLQRELDKLKKSIANITTYLNDVNARLKALGG